MMSICRQSGIFLASCFFTAFAVYVPLAAGQTATTPKNPPSVGPLAGQPFVRMTGDIRGYELVPSFNGVYKDASFRTNQWGMRDEEYPLKPPPRTYRIALLGSSFSMGAGVPESETHEALLEDRLNREGPGAPKRRYEILNFAVGGYGILQNVGVVDKKVFAFSPNAVLLVIHSNEASRIVRHLTSEVLAGIPIEYPELRQKLEQAGVRPGMLEPELLRRISPLTEQLLTWSYEHIARRCHENGITLVGIAFAEPRFDGPNCYRNLARWHRQPESQSWI